jgi:hypothetical protein
MTRMQRLEQIPAEEMQTVVRIASEMYENDRQLAAEAGERQAAVAAAKEVGLPDEYLERAAEEWQRRQTVTRPTLQNQQAKVMLLVGLVVAGLLLLLMLMARPTLAPPSIAPPPIEAPRQTAPSPLPDGIPPPPSPTSVQ